MKRLICAALVIALAIALSGCGGEKEAAVDIDLTALSSTVAYSTMYNMMSDPDSYRGKTVKMSGTFSDYYSEGTGVRYFTCLLYDSTACCQLGFEFTLGGSPKYPDDYPADGSSITVSGVFGTYDEYGVTYCRLTDAKFCG